MIPAPSPVGAEPTGEPSDEDLVERVRRGDAAAYDALVSRHLERAFRLAFRVLGNREDAEDLVQDAFLTVLEKIGSFERGRPFLPWFNRIIVNKGLNARESRSLRQTENIPESIATSYQSPARYAEQAEVRDRVMAAIAGLPERQQAIVGLFELEGFSGVEIAEMLEISPGTVRWHLHEARRALRAALAPLERKEDR
jgi:RNA polymerase sigma-70 factor, ECF subfamily